MLETFKHATKRQNLYLRVAKGHFATNDRHSNYYIDVAAQKARLSEAKAIAEELSTYILHSTIVDTILCYYLSCMPLYMHGYRFHHSTLLNLQQQVHQTSPRIYNLILMELVLLLVLANRILLPSM